MISEHVAKKLGIRNLVDRLVKTSEICRGRLADVRDREGVKPARKRESPRAFGRLDRFRGIFLAKDARRFFGAEI